MIESKLFEVRDEGTFIPVLCTLIPDNWMMRHVGFDGPTVLLTQLSSLKTDYFPLGRTLGHAYDFISGNWNNLINGQVIDVRVILGESEIVCQSEENNET